MRDCAVSSSCSVVNNTTSYVTVIDFQYDATSLSHGTGNAACRHGGCFHGWRIYLSEIHAVVLCGRGEAHRGIKPQS